MAPSTGLQTSSPRKSAASRRGISSTVPTKRDQRNTRSTRSASRELSDNEAASTEPQRSTGRPKRRRDGAEKKRALRAAPAHDLSVVIEAPERAEEAEENPVQEPSDEHEEQQEEGNQTSARRVSGISGTTARDSNTAQELAQLSAEEMQDTLPDLISGTQKLWDFLSRQARSEAAIETLSTSIQTRDSKEYRTLKRFLPGYQAQKDVYGNERYIDVSTAINTILPSHLFRDAGDGPWRPDNILYFTNLTQFIYGLVCIHRDNRLKFLEDTDRDYPSQFMSRVLGKRNYNGDTGCSALSRLTFEGGVHIRTQLCLLKFQDRWQEPGFVAADFIDEIFATPYDPFRGFNADGLRAEELPIRYQQKIATVTSRLKGLLSGKPEFETANSEYSWSKAVVELISWASERKEEIESQLASHGGSEGVYDALSAEIKRREDLQIVEDVSTAEMKEGEGLQSIEDASTVETERRDGMQTVRIASPEGNVETRKLSAIELIKRRKSEAMQTVAVASLEDNYETKKLSAIELIRRRKSEAKLLAKAHSNDNDEISAGSGAQSLSSIKKKPAHSELPEEDKENSPGKAKAQFKKPRHFIDPQENAQRIEFDSQTSDSANRGTSKRKREEPLMLDDEEKNISRSKRRRQKSPVLEQEDGDRSTSERQQQRSPVYDNNDDDYIPDPSPDEGFQRDDRQSIPQSSLIPGPKRRRKPRKVTEQREMSISDSEPFDADAEINAQLQRPNRQPPRAQLEVNQSPPGTQLEELRAASQNAVLKRGLQAKPTKEKRKWTDMETKKLEYYITKFGISWSMIKTHDAKKETRRFLAARDQVAMKDKARNLKMEYLRSKKPLPPNFELIHLKQADIQNLRTFRDDVDELLPNAGN